MRRLVTAIAIWLVLMAGITLAEDYGLSIHA